MNHAELDLNEAKRETPKKTQNKAKKNNAKKMKQIFLNYSHISVL